MNMLQSLKYRLFPADPKSVVAYRSALPADVKVTLRRDKGYLIATLRKIGSQEVKGLLITEAKNEDDLIANVNDLVFTHVGVPLNIRPYYGSTFFRPNGYKRNASTMTLVRG